jgi:hypothetical protein
MQIHSSSNVSIEYFKFDDINGKWTSRHATRMVDELYETGFDRIGILLVLSESKDKKKKCIE